tara:strand:+ start:4751 stop:5101 length:351 start_codon:yes stop_codon:yes gene_type:complete
MALEKKIILQKRDFEVLTSLTIKWRISIVEKLRSARLMLKKLKKDEFTDIYESLKRLEISSEFIEHNIIIKFFLEKNRFDVSYLPAEEICDFNLRNYFESLNIDNINYKRFINLLF